MHEQHCTCAKPQAGHPKYTRPHAYGLLVRPRRRLISLATMLLLLGDASTSVYGRQPPGQTAEASPGVSAETPRIAATDDEAEPEDLAELSLEELMDVDVVVTASRRAQRKSTLPYAVTVITAADIRASGARTVPDAMRLAPGMDVAELNSGQTAVSPRGLHGFLGRSVLILVDGRQIFDSLFGGNLWGNWPFQLEDIERIEIIRGPGGVTWGANAVNGVINIITKDPADQQGVVLTLGGGSRGQHKEHVGIGWRDGDTRFRFSMEFEGNDGFRGGGSILGALDDDYKASRMTLFGIHDFPTGDTLTFSAGSAVVDGGIARTPLGGLGQTRNAGSQANFVMAKWSHEIKADSVIEFTGYINDFQASPGLKQIDYRYQQIALQLAHTYKTPEDRTVTWGIDTRVDLLDAGNSDPQLLERNFVSTGIIGVYAQEDWHLNDAWSVSLGGRVDYESYGGFQPSARASLLREFDNGSVVYSSISRAFQMPPVGVRFVDFPVANGLVQITGTRSLDVETLWAYEVGYRGTVFEKLELSMNLFWEEFSDLTTLSGRLGPPGLINLNVDNLADASLYGFELDAKYPLSERLTLLGNYTFERLDWRSDVPFVDKDLISPPEHKFMLGARYSPTDDLHLSGHLFYVDRVIAPRVEIPSVSRSIDAYWRLDLQASVDFWDETGSLTFGVRNLLDDQHAEGGTTFMNFAEVPRMVYVEFRYAIAP